MIALEATEGKFDKAAHAKRLDVIIDSFDKINEIAREEIPSVSDLTALFSRLGLEEDYSYLGLTREDTLNAFIYSADIRDKYVLSRLFWDLGITDIASEVI